MNRFDPLPTAETKPHPFKGGASRRPRDGVIHHSLDPQLLEFHCASLCAEIIESGAGMVAVPGLINGKVRRKLLWRSSSGEMEIPHRKVIVIHPGMYGCGPEEFA